jgi:hypothetical protein
MRGSFQTSVYTQSSMHHSSLQGIEPEFVLPIMMNLCCKVGVARCVPKGAIYAAMLTKTPQNVIYLMFTL